MAQEKPLWELLSDQWSWQEQMENNLEAKEQVEFLTEWVHRPGQRSNTLVEYWDALCLGFLVFGWEDKEHWRRRAAIILDISENTLRQREYNFRKQTRRLYASLNKQSCA